MLWSMKAAIHFGPELRTKFEDIESVFNITQKVQHYSEVDERTSEEILNVKCLEYSSLSWTRSVVANDQAIKWKKVKVCLR